MGWQTWIRLGLLLLALAGCSPPASPTPDPSPRDAFANGTAGVPISYCVEGYCADGGIDVSLDYPEVAFPVTLTFERPIHYITAEARAASDTEVRSLTVIGADADGTPHRETLRLESVPPGDWVYLTVSAGFEGQDDGSYVWRIVDH